MSVFEELLRRKSMSLNSHRRFGLRPSQFTMAQMVAWVVLAAVACCLIRNWQLSQSIMFFVIALSFVAIGLRSIVVKRPFLITSRWHPTFMILGFLPTFIHPALSISSNLHARQYSYLALMALLASGMIFGCVKMWMGSRGYSAYGVTGESFREGLLAALNKLELPYEESLSVIRLTSIGADLQAMVWSSHGSGSIKIEPHKVRTGARRHREGDERLLPLLRRASENGLRLASAHRRSDHDGWRRLVVLLAITRFAEHSLDSRSSSLRCRCGHCQRR